MRRENKVPMAATHRPGGDGRPLILFVHGWMASGHIWDRLRPLLDDFQLVIPDLRGSGDFMHTGNVTLDDYLGDLALLCEQQELENVHLVGHSMGAQLAMLLAARLPERFASLVLMTPVPVHGLPLPGEIRQLFRNGGHNRESFARILDLACVQLDPQGRDAMLDDAMTIAPAVISSGFDAWREGVPSAPLERVVMPTTVVSTDDPFLPPAFLDEAVVARLPNARRVHLAGPGHYPQMEAPAQTTALLRDLLR